MTLDDAGLLWRTRLLASGVADDELRQWLRSGALVTVRRGAYVSPGVLPQRPEARHALLVRAALPALAAGAVISHVSAAVLHGLPVWDIALDRVHVTRSRRSGARLAAALHVHAAPLEPGEIVHVDGIACTSVVRTVLDIARTVGFEHAVVVADAALHRGLLTADALGLSLDAAPRRPGNPAARRVVAFASAGSESVGESRSRVALWRAGLPAPVLQWQVWSRTGRPLGYVDFGWPELLTVGEFDGRTKYGRLLKPGQEPGEAVFAEKVREDAIRDENLRMTRWGWQDLDDFGPVAERLRRAFRRA